MSQETDVDLHGLAARYGVRAIDDLPFGAQPLDRDDIEDETTERLDNLGWERAAEAWQPIATGGTPSLPPKRFIDGSVSGRTVAVFNVAGSLRPALLAV